MRQCHRADRADSRPDTRSAGRYIGDFTNAEYGITGSIRITLSGNSLSAALAGGGGSASINLNR